MVTLALLAALTLSAAPERYDLILENARVVDGTGAPWFRADVAIRGDRIAAVGDLHGAKAQQRIDVHDHVIAPGFIDLLGQSELTLLLDPRAESKVRQGVTSELTGEGLSVEPMTPALAAESKDWLAVHRLTIDWSDLSGYCGASARRGRR